MKGKNLKGDKKHMYDALYASLGNVTAACKQTGVGRTTHYKWMNEDEEYKEAVDNLEEVTHDFVENQLLKKIKEGDKACIIFYLKTKARARGYIEKQELQHSGTGAENAVRVEFVEAKEAEQNGNEGE